MLTKSGRAGGNFKSKVNPGDLPLNRDTWSLCWHSYIMIKIQAVYRCPLLNGFFMSTQEERGIVNYTVIMHNMGVLLQNTIYVMYTATTLATAFAEKL